MAKSTTNAKTANAFTIEIINSDFNIHHVLKSLKQIDKFYYKEVQFWNSFNVGPQLPLSAIVKDLNNRYQEFSRWNATDDSLSDHTRVNEWNKIYKPMLESPYTLERVAYPHSQGYGNKTEFLPIFFSDSLEAIALKKYRDINGDISRLYWFIIGEDIKFIDKSTMELVDFARANSLLRTANQDSIFMANMQHFTMASNDLREAITEYQDEKDSLFAQLRQDAEELKTNLLNEDKQRKESYKAILIALEEKLRVEAPIVEWQKQADYHRKTGRLWITITSVSIVVLASLLTCILYNLPASLGNNIFDGDPAAIKSLILLASIVSFGAYFVRLTTRIAISSFHLERDAEERKRMTHVFLGLVKDSTISKEERSLFMQAVFSRADTGLLKRDSVPEMPGTTSIIDRIVDNAR